MIWLKLGKKEGGVEGRGGMMDGERKEKKKITEWQRDKRGWETWEGRISESEQGKKKQIWKKKNNEISPSIPSWWRGSTPRRDDHTCRRLWTWTWCCKCRGLASLWVLPPWWWGTRTPHLVSGRSFPPCSQTYQLHMRGGEETMASTTWHPDEMIPSRNLHIRERLTNQWSPLYKRFGIRDKFNPKQTLISYTSKPGL